MEKVCCNCEHCIRKGEAPNIDCYCDIDGGWLSYVMVMVCKCKRWKDADKERNKIDNRQARKRK